MSDAPAPTLVILLRHGTAEPSAPGGDRERRLAPGAGGAVREAARRIAAHGPARALVSSAVRTRETFEACRAEWPGIEVEMRPAIYNAGANDLVALAGNGTGPLVIVGHNPGITGAAQAMSGGAFADVMRPADAVVVDYDPATGTGRLVEHIRPQRD